MLIRTYKVLCISCHRSGCPLRSSRVIVCYPAVLAHHVGRLRITRFDKRKVLLHLQEKIGTVGGEKRHRDPNNIMKKPKGTMT